MQRTIEIDQQITVRDLAHQLQLPASKLRLELEKNGHLTTLNEKIPFEIVEIVIEELGLDVKLIPKASPKLQKSKPKRVSNDSDMITRPPVVVVMGHVDHGKTTLLDKIRGSELVKREAGGITQHISIHQIKHPNSNGRAITFLDTPGHEAFAALRQYGANLTDIVLLVIAADDGIKDQTLEAIRFAKQSKVKLIVAITKIDKETANLSLINQQLADQGLTPEGLGGDTIVVTTSAKTGAGIEELLDMVILTADIENFAVAKNSQTTGFVIESYARKGLGSVATILVTSGTLKKGDLIVANQVWGRVRLILDTSSERELNQAGPSTPVVVSGLNGLVKFGSEFVVVESEKAARQLAQQQKMQTDFKSIGMSSGELLRLIERQVDLDEFKVIIKADSQGSLVSILDSLKAFDNDEVAIKVIEAAAAPVSEHDIQTAQIVGAVIYSFNLETSGQIEQLASQSQVVIKNYSVIYELLEDAKQELENLLKPLIEMINIGDLEVAGVFKTSKDELLCGGKVLTKKISHPAQVKVLRDKDIIAEAKVLSLAKEALEVNEVFQNQMCGVKLKTESKINLKVGDVLHFYRIETTKRKL